MGHSFLVNFLNYPIPTALALNEDWDKGDERFLISYFQLAGLKMEPQTFLFETMHHQL